MGKGETWDSRYDTFIARIKANDYKRLPKDDLISYWFINQKSRYMKGILSEERLEKLKAFDKDIFKKPLVEILKEKWYKIYSKKSLGKRSLLCVKDDRDFLYKLHEMGVEDVYGLMELIFKGSRSSVLDDVDPYKVFLLICSDKGINCPDLLTCKLAYLYNYGYQYLGADCFRYNNMYKFFMCCSTAELKDVLENFHVEDMKDLLGEFLFTIVSKYADGNTFAEVGKDFGFTKYYCSLQFKRAVRKIAYHQN